MEKILESPEGPRCVADDRVALRMGKSPSVQGFLPEKRCDSSYQGQVLPS